MMLEQFEFGCVVQTPDGQYGKLVGKNIITNTCEVDIRGLIHIYPVQKLTKLIPVTECIDAEDILQTKVLCGNTDCIHQDNGECQLNTITIANGVCLARKARSALDIWNEICGLDVDQNNETVHEWNYFPEGTYFYDIQRWFEKEYNVSINDAVRDVLNRGSYCEKAEGTCTFTRHNCNDFGYYYKTSCGMSYVSYDERYKRCPYCGKEIEVVE